MRLLRQADDVLRGAPARAAGVRLHLLAGLLLGCGLFYGSVMGTFGGVTGDRLWQVVYSAVKVPLLLGVTFLLSLPSFFVLNTLLGVRDDFAAVLRALLASQAGLTVILAALAPYTVLWYASFTGYAAALLFNALMFAVASIAAQGLLWRSYQPLIARRPVHRWLLRLWLVVYAFVGIQMGWVLRPFVGVPGLPVRFFREDTWDNAYVIVARLIWQSLP